MPDPKLPVEFKKFDINDPNPCAGCSNCCEYVAIEIDRPTTIKDFNNILWYIIHKDVWVYIDEEKDWYVQFNSPCEKLVDKRCDYYPYRPQICRDYEPRDCVRYGDEDEEEVMFKNERDLFKYLAKKRPRMFDKLHEKIGIPYSREELLENNFAANL